VAAAKWRLDAIGNWTAEAGFGKITERPSTLKLFRHRFSSHPLPL